MLPSDLLDFDLTVETVISPKYREMSRELQIAYWACCGMINIHVMALGLILNVAGHDEVVYILIFFSIFFPPITHLAGLPLIGLLTSRKWNKIGWARGQSRSRG